jgi:hypothetical protein
MIFNAPRRISISSQPEKFSYEVGISALNQSGRLILGFSGESGNFLNYTLQSGRVFDFDGDFVYSYGTASSIAISANVEDDQQSYFINGLPIKLSQTLNTGAGQIDAFYVQPLNISPNITFSFFGEKPAYSLGQINFSELDPTGTGYIINTDPTRYFQFGSGLSATTDFSYVSGFTGVLNPGQSGAILIKKNFIPSSSEDFSDSAFAIPVQLYTNFGEFSVDLSGQNNFSPSQNLTTDFSTTVSGSGNFNNFFNWQNLRGLSSFTASGLPLTFTLSRISGAGIFTGIWNLQTGTQTFPYVYSDVPYNAGIQAYSGDLNTFGASGISVNIQRLTPSGQQVLEFDIYGYSQNITISYTGN